MCRIVHPLTLDFIDERFVALESFPHNLFLLIRAEATTNHQQSRIAHILGHRIIVVLEPITEPTADVLDDLFLTFVRLP
jgi:hypothetical protein